MNSQSKCEEEMERGRERIDGEEKSRRERIYFRTELSYLQRYFWITMFFMLMVERLVVLLILFHCLTLVGISLMLVVVVGKVS